MRIVWAGAFLLCLSAAASAQSAKESAKDFTPAGAYITAPVAKELGQARASEFSKAASSAGFTTRETRLIARGLRDATIKVVNPKASAWRQTFKTLHGSVTVSTIEQAGLIRRAMGYLPYSDFFDQYATLRLSVRSPLSRDFKVTINGETCPATDKASYLVPPGKVSVTVTRAGKPACAWSGTVEGKKERTVECRL
jgi:hypothetical protein